MASSTPSSSATSSNTGADPNTTNLRPTTYDTWCGVAHGCTRKLGLKICGFLQRTNSLEEKSRLVSAFKERQSSKNLPDDGVRHDHGWLPAPRGQGQLLPDGHLQPSRYPV
uniref:Glutamate decarboxylase 1 n=1 Tax=Nomascus leucogenys TaxID=61853 RepID=A0A2I3HIK8_NOMLE